jgi:hypothetical protein
MREKMNVSPGRRLWSHGKGSPALSGVQLMELGMHPKGQTKIVACTQK